MSAVILSDKFNVVAIGSLAIERHKAADAVRFTKGAYHDALVAQRFKHGGITEDLDPGNPAHLAILTAVRAEYLAFKAAKSTAYNLQRRLSSACRKERA